MIDKETFTKEHFEKIQRNKTVNPLVLVFRKNLIYKSNIIIDNMERYLH